VPLVRHPALLDALAEVYSENLYLYENSLVYKPPGTRNEVPWHQDFMNRTREPFKVIAWMPLDPVRRENGCLWVIPGSHRAGFLPYTRVRGETHHTRLDLASAQIDEGDAVELELDPGQVLLFHCALVHCSRRVESPAPRRVFRAAYMNMERSVVPRGSPLVVRLGDPSVLARPHRYPFLLQRILRKLADIFNVG